MKIEEFSNKQKLAVLDLAMLAMYADGHLTAVEDDRVQGLLGQLGFDSEYDRGKQYDASVSRVSRHSQTAEAARTYAAELAQVLSAHEQRRLVQEVMDALVTSDRHVTLQESSLLAVVRDALKA